MGALHPGRLIDLAVRLPAYAGVVAARARADETPTSSPEEADGVRYVDPTIAGIAGDPALGGLFDFGEEVG